MNIVPSSLRVGGCTSCVASPNGSVLIKLVSGVSVLIELHTAYRLPKCKLCFVTYVILPIPFALLSSLLQHRSSAVGDMTLYHCVDVVRQLE